MFKHFVSNKKTGTYYFFIWCCARDTTTPHTNWLLLPEPHVCEHGDQGEYSHEYDAYVGALGMLYL